MASNRDSSIVINVSPPRGGRALDAIKRTSARSVVDGLAEKYRFGVMKRASKMTRDEYAVSPGGTATVVASYPADGNDYNIVQKDGVCYVVKTPAGYSGKLDQGSVALGERGDTGSLTDQTSADLREGKAEDAVFAQLKKINALNRKRRGSSDMSAQAADEVWSGMPGSSEMVRSPYSNLPGEGDDGGETMDCPGSLPADENMQKGESMDRAVTMQSRNRQAWARWSGVQA